MLHAQLLQPNHRADDIHNRINAAHLVKMHFFHRDAMHLRFSFAQAGEDFAGG